MDLLSQLNDSQAAAVAYNEGPHLVIAGAGSGKTRVLTYKIAYLLQQGMPAHRILALTFTNKAAREMKERIGKLVGEREARYLWMGTFHSICAKILRAEAQRLGYTRDFSIYDTTDSKSLIKQILKDKGLGGKDDKVYKDNAVLGKISSAKNALMTASDYAMNANVQKQDRIDRMYEMANIFREYELRLRAANAMDFDDLLVNVCRLLRADQEVLNHYQQVFEYVLVDEYQDTNYAQYLLVNLLAAPQNRVCVVGDDAQSIYSFRGADIRNILSFQNGYPDARLFKLERNYRSTQTIVEAANSLIHHNQNQIFKQVYSENSVGDRLQLRTYMSDREEAEGVARLVVEEHRLRKLSLDQIAVLYRTNSQSRAFENELRKLGVPYRIYGGTSFYQRKEIKDAISYFRLAANPQDNEALNRVINFPRRGLGDTTIRKVSEHALHLGISVMDVVSHPMETGLDVSASVQKRLMQFALLMQRFGEDIDGKDAYEFAEQVLRESGIMTEAIMDRTPEGIDRKQNLDELLAGIHDFVQQRRDQGIDFTPIQDFLGEVALLTDQDEHTDERTARVTLMTVHAAKGLEFPVVFIVGLEENLFPSQYCTRASEIEEERRLLYVAITRAMERCYLSGARQRFKNGSINFASPSRFLNDIDRRYLQQVDTFQPSNSFDRPRWQNSSWGADSSSSRQSAGSYSSQSSASRTTTTTPPSHFTRLSSNAGSDSSVGLGFVAPAESGADSASSPESAAPFVPNDRVSHRVFGEGTVQRVYRENDNDKIDILFDGPGKKTLLLTFAKLTKL